MLPHYVFKTSVEEMSEKGIITSNLCFVKREMGLGWWGGEGGSRKPWMFFPFLFPAASSLHTRVLPKKGLYTRT